MHFTMLRSISVMDETNNYRLWEHIQKITWFHIFLAKNEIFPSLISDSTMSKQHTMTQSCSSYLCLWKFKAMLDDVLEIAVSWPGLITLTSTISSIVTIDIDSCSVIITSHFILICDRT